MAIRRRYYSQVQARTGDLYRIEVWDLNHSTNSGLQGQQWGWVSTDDDDIKELTTLYDSVEIVWDGDDTKVHQPILGSTFRMTVLAEKDADMGIVTAIKFGLEFKVGIKVLRWNYDDNVYDPIWYGCVLPEAITHDFSDFPKQLQIVATDGLSTLRDRPYMNTSDDTLYGQTASTVHQPAHVQIGRCLKLLPHIDLWGDTDILFAECADLLHESHATLDDDDEITSVSSIVNNVECNQNIWYEERAVNPPFFRDTNVRVVGATAYDVISNWMTTLGLRMSMTNGLYFAVSPFLRRITGTKQRRDRLYKYEKRIMLDSAYYDTDPTLADTDTDLLPTYWTLTEQGGSKYLVGSTKSSLHALRGVYYKHLQGGAARIFPETKWVAVEGDFPQTDISVTALGQIYELSQNYNVSFPLSNDEVVVPTAVPLRMSGIFQHWFRPADTSDEDTAIGAQFEVKMKIKVGDNYLKQSVGLVADADLSDDSDFGTIVKGGADITTWKPLVITDDVAWTTNSADRFSFPAYLDGSVNKPVTDMLEYVDSDGNITEYHPGFGCTRHPDNPNKQRYNTQSRGVWLQAYEVNLDFMLPELPDSNVEETGVEITVEVIMYKNDGTTTTVTDEVFPTNPIRPDGARIINFNMFVGDGTDEDDAFYYAELVNSRGNELIVGGETLVASRVDEDYGELGVITANGEFTHKWHSENNFTLGSGRRNLEVLAEEHSRLRGRNRDFYNMRVLAADLDAIPHPHQEILIKDAGDSIFVIPFNMTHALAENAVIFSGVALFRDATSITAANDADKKDNGVNVIGGGGITGTTQVFRPKVRSGGGGSGISQENLEKLGHITSHEGGITGFTVKSGATVLTSDEINDDSSAHKFATSQQISDIGTNKTKVSALEGRMNTAESDITTLEGEMDDVEGDVSTLTNSVNALAAAIKSDSGGDGKGVYDDPQKDTTKSHLSVTSTGAKVQAGANTKYAATETSPGVLSMVVQAGASGNEAAKTAMTITGSSVASTKADVNITSGVNLNVAGDIDVDGDIVGDTIRTDSNVDLTLFATGSGEIIAKSPITTIGNANLRLDAHGTGNIVLRKDLITESNGDIVLDPHGTGAIILKSDNIKFEAAAASTFTGEIKLYESTLLTPTNYIGLKAPLSVTADTTLTLPDGDGSQGQALKTDGSGALGWTDVLNGENETLSGITNIKKLGGSSGQLAFYDDLGDNYIVLRAPATLTENTVYNLPATEGGNGEVLQTNGSGTLSWTTMPMVALANVSGRFYWQSTDDGERVYTGSSIYGPYNYYSHTTEPSPSTFKNYSGSEVAGVTSTSIAGSHMIQYGIKNPYSGKKVRVDYSFRIYYSGSSAPTTGTPFGFSLWSGNANATGSASNVTVRYRGESDDHGMVAVQSGGTSAHHHGSFTTSTNIEDDYLFVLAEHRSSTGLNSNTFMVANYNVFITD